MAIDIGFDPINKDAPIIETRKSRKILKWIALIVLYTIPVAGILVGVYFLTKKIVTALDSNNKLSQKTRTIIQWVVAGAFAALTLFLMIRIEKIRIFILKIALSFAYL
jgi:flagellar basal body-associated protein FliL